MISSENQNNNDFFKYKLINTNLSPFELNNEGRGLALVLRYALCNLRCPLCYAWKIAWLPNSGFSNNIYQSIQKLSKLSQHINFKYGSTKKVTWVRIQGGEPCMNYNRIVNTINFSAEALKQINNQNLNYYNITRAIIQTNGIGFSYLSSSQLENLRFILRNILPELENKGKIIFEISFKSPNDTTFKDFNGKPVLNSQIQGFTNLLNQVLIPLWEENIHNISIYPAAGLGPSLNKPWLIPIDPDPKYPSDTPLFHPSTWSGKFQDFMNYFLNKIVQRYPTYQDFIKNPLSNNGKKIAIEELEPDRFQISWISGYAGNYQKNNMHPPEVSQILRKLSNDINKQWYALIKNNQNWINVFNQIPIANNQSAILSAIIDMKNHFYPSHPIGHYPSL
ncbi:MAG: 4Fe-4S cluster-binding domain-containing protein [Candidatus Micrarchaeaceae archaeon]